MTTPFSRCLSPTPVAATGRNTEHEANGGDQLQKREPRPAVGHPQEDPRAGEGKRHHRSAWKAEQEVSGYGGRRGALRAGIQPQADAAYT